MSYVALANITLGSSASSVTFSSIPNTFRDLVVVANMTNVATLGGYPAMRLNGDNGTNYSTVFMAGSGATFGSWAGLDSFIYLTYDYGKNNTYAIAQVMDYSATDKHKTLLSRASTTDAGYITGGAHRWANTTAVTSLTLILTPRTFEAGCSFALYGIRS